MSDHYSSPAHDNWTSSDRNPSVISTLPSRYRRDSTSSNPPPQSSYSNSERDERSAGMDGRSGEEEEDAWSRQQQHLDRSSRKSVLVSHRRGSITEGTPLDLSGYSRTSGENDESALAEARFIRNRKLGNIGSVVERPVPLDLSGNPPGGENIELSRGIGSRRGSTVNSTYSPGPSQYENRPSRPSSNQSNSSLSSMGVMNSLYPQIDLSRLQPTSLSNVSMSRPSWLPQPPSTSIFVPPPPSTSRSVPMTNPFLAFSMHSARLQQAKGTVSKLSETGTKITTTSSISSSNYNIPTSVPRLNIPPGVAAASTLSRPPTIHSRTVNAINLPTTELTRAPPSLMNLGNAGSQVLNYQGGTISIGSAAEPPSHVAAKTVLFSGGEPQTPRSVPEIRIKQEPVDHTEVNSSPCPHSRPHSHQNGVTEEQHQEETLSYNTQQEQHLVKSSPDGKRSRGEERSEVNKEDESKSVQEPVEKPATPVVIKQEVASAN